MKKTINTIKYIKTKWMYFLIKDDDFFEKYNTIWDKASTNIKRKICKQIGLQ